MPLARVLPTDRVLILAEVPAWKFEDSELSLDCVRRDMEDKMTRLADEIGAVIGPIAWEAPRICDQYKMWIAAAWQEGSSGQLKMFKIEADNKIQTVPVPVGDTHA